MDYSSFYKPQVMNLGAKFQIVYPLKGIEKLLNVKSKDISVQLSKLFELYPKLLDCQFQIVIIWADISDIMADVWLFKSLESEESGYLIDCRNYRAFEENHESAITASDGLSLLGRESELAETYRKAGKGIEEYVNGERPRGNFIE